MMAPMKRVPGFKRAQKADEGWVVVKVKLRPAVVAALKSEATQESEKLHRQVYVSDLLRDAIRLLLLARRIDPYAPAQRFQPSDKSEG